MEEILIPIFKTLGIGVVPGVVILGSLYLLIKNTILKPISDVKKQIKEIQDKKLNKGEFGVIETLFEKRLDKIELELKHNRDGNTKIIERLASIETKLKMLLRYLNGKKR